MGDGVLMAMALKHSSQVFARCVGLEYATEFANTQNDLYFALSFVDYTLLLNTCCSQQKREQGNV
jgi:hypothetical protein